MTFDSVKFLLIIAVLLLGFVLGWFLKPSSAPKINVSAPVHIDTVVSFIPSAPVIIQNAKSKLVFVHDTVYSVDSVFSFKSFVASLDTVIKSDTLALSFSFPRMEFGLHLYKKPDSLFTRIMYIDRDVLRDRPWYETPATVLVSALFGFGIGRIR